MGTILRLKIPPEYRRPQPDFPCEDYITLINASMVTPIDRIQCIYPNMFKYTKSEITNSLKSAIRSPPNLSHEPIYPDPKIPFTNEENYFLLQFANSHPSDTDIQLADLERISPIRPMEEIISQVRLIQSMPLQEKSKIVDQYCNEVFADEMEFLSATAQASVPGKEEMPKAFIKQFSCVSRPIPCPQLSTQLDQAISQLQSEVIGSGRLGALFHDNDLAVLRGVKAQFFMRRTAILVGRSLEADVDLSLLSDPCCKHISRRQAILSFLSDSNFYIENIGERAFRVNGRLIPRGSACVVPPFAIIDFSGVLLFLIPNKRLTESD